MHIEIDIARLLGSMNYSTSSRPYIITIILLLVITRVLGASLRKGLRHVDGFGSLLLGYLSAAPARGVVRRTGCVHVPTVTKPKKVMIIMLMII